MSSPLEPAADAVLVDNPDAPTGGVSTGGDPTGGDATSAAPIPLGEVPFVSGWGPADRTGIIRVPGGLTRPDGFTASGVRAGLKPSGRHDLGLVVSSTPASVAAVTTTNEVVAAPVLQTRAVAASGRARAVVVNSGNANACTGPQGHTDALATATAVARALSRGEEVVADDDVVVLSTGVIGVPMTMSPLLAGVRTAVAALGDTAQHGEDAARATCTTDTFVKQLAVRVSDEQGACTIAGCVKGAGMIEPAMATLLCVVTTDAPVPTALLRSSLQQASARTFNRISVDACGSTNDTVVVLANAASPTAPSVATFQRGLEALLADLAAAVVMDGEETNRTALLHVRGAADDAAAERLARAVAASTLFRAALAGGDPNWGRVLAALGTAGVGLDPDAVGVVIGGVPVCSSGTAMPFDRERVAALMAQQVSTWRITVGSGPGEARYLTADLTPGYVHFNSAYTT